MSEDMKEYYIDRIGEITKQHEDERAEIVKTIGDLQQALNTTVQNYNNAQDQIAVKEQELEMVRAELEAKEALSLVEEAQPE